MTSRHADHLGSGLADVRLRHRALPERDLASVSLRTRLLERPLEAPLVISATTGEAAEVNRRLMHAAAAHGIALVLGDRDRPSPQDRPPLLLAELGAAQVRGRDALWRAAELVELLEADGLSIHLNPLQEAVQPEGRPDFSGVLEGIAAVAAHIAPAPVVVREAGFGLDFEDVSLLREAGVAAIDVGGAGVGDVPAAFSGWGHSTVEALTDARAAAPGLPLIASGGLRDGVDVAKCIALGATAGGLSLPLLVAAQAGRAEEAVAAIVEQLRIATWLTGAGSVHELGREHLR